jgi:hypothetical protein
MTREDRLERLAATVVLLAIALTAAVLLGWLR